VIDQTKNGNQIQLAVWSSVPGGFQDGCVRKVLVQGDNPDA
jgi:hypothetical protein